MKTSNKKTSNKKTEGVYYGVAGSNAYGVYDDYELVTIAKQYVMKFKCRKFTNKIEAQEWVLDTHIDLESDNSFYSFLELPKRTNWLYHQKKKWIV